MFWERTCCLARQVYSLCPVQVSQLTFYVPYSSVYWATCFVPGFYLRESSPAAPKISIRLQNKSKGWEWPTNKAPSCNWLCSSCPISLLLISRLENLCWSCFVFHKQVTICWMVWNCEVAALTKNCFERTWNVFCVAFWQLWIDSWTGFEAGSLTWKQFQVLNKWCAYPALVSHWCSLQRLHWCSFHLFLQLFKPQ